jgi:hypothetical protein
VAISTRLDIKAVADFMITLTCRCITTGSSSTVHTGNL